MNKMLLHGEGLVVFALCVYGYTAFEFNWLLFAILLFAPDISMLGYLINPRVGAIIYNLLHTYILSIGVVALGWFLAIQILLAVGLIWTAHIGLDRIFGYGLKYPTGFKNTHLQRV